jgi:hypothetical protein
MTWCEGLDLVLPRKGAATIKFPGQQDATVLHGMGGRVNIRGDRRPDRSPQLS